MCNFDLTGLEQNRWNDDLVFEWDLASDIQTCSVKDEKGKEIAPLPLNFDTVNGFSYAHFISTADKEDRERFLIKEVASKP